MLYVCQASGKYCQGIRQIDVVSPTSSPFSISNLDPDIIGAFQDLCRKQGKQDIQVLEGLIGLYLKSSGTILEEMARSSFEKAVPASNSITTRGTYAEMLERLERVETDNREFVSAFEILIHRVDTLESQISCKDLEKRLDHLEQAFQYRKRNS